MNTAQIICSSSRRLGRFVLVVEIYIVLEMKVAACIPCINMDRYEPIFLTMSWALRSAISAAITLESEQ